MANKLIVSAAPHITSADSTSKIMGRVCIALLPTLIASVLIFGFQALLLTAVTVVIGMRMMGTLLIASLIIFPALISKRLVKSFKAVVAVSSFVSVICFLFGLCISFFLDLPVGASIVAVNLVALAAAAIISKVKN